MENIIGKNNRLSVQWRLLNTEGEPFDLTGYELSLLISSGRGRTDVTNVTVSGTDNNIVSWIMEANELYFLGNYTLCLALLKYGVRFATVIYRDAFRVSSRFEDNCGCTQQIFLSSFVNVIHSISPGGGSVDAITVGDSDPYLPDWDRIVHLPAYPSVSWTPVLTSGTKIATIVIDGISQDVYAPNGGGGGSVVSWTPVLTSGTKIATIVIDGESQDVYAPNGGGGGSEVSWTPVLTSGTKIATIVIDGESQDVYAPNGGGGGTVTSVDIAVPSSFFTVNGGPVTDSGTITIGLKSTTKILTTNEYEYLLDARHTHGNYNVLEGITYSDVNDWDAAAAAAHSHVNKSVLDGINETKTQQWSIAYNAIKNGVVTSIAGLQGNITQAQLQELVEAGSSMCFAAPRLQLRFGSENLTDEVFLRITHPLIGSLPGVQAVLMVKSSKNHSAYETDVHSKYRRYRRNGWCVARSGDGSRILIANSRALDLHTMLQYIARYYTQIQGQTKEQMEAMSYGSLDTPESGTWQKMTGRHAFGWPEDESRNIKNAKKFGIALRIPNPDFEHYVVGELSEHTQMIYAQNAYIPRYFYTDVAEMVVHIQENTTTQTVALGVGIK